MSRVAVIGAGAWGIALAIHAARAGHAVSLTTRAHGLVPGRLPGFALPEAVAVSSEMPEHADLILLAVPMQHLRAILERLRPAAPLIICCKGIETHTAKLPLELVAELHPCCPAGVLTGPNFAAGIAAGQPAAAVLAADDAKLRQACIGLLGTPEFRLYGNADATGAQLGGAAKNVFAIAAGVVMGAGYGENARAALITRGLAELARLIVAQGGRAETAAGLSGLGDLVLTCTGAGSRNYAYGLALGAGVAAPAGGVVEGVTTAPALMLRAGSMELPICAAVAALLAGRASVSDSVLRLLSRARRDEFDAA